jgi:glycosyltransferase involved in cell wall biosynthesis
MLRHLREPGGITVYTTSLLDALLRLDRSNTYVLLHRDRVGLDRFAGAPNVEQAVLAARTKVTWDQVAVPAAALRHGLDLIFNPKLSVPLAAGMPTVFVLHGGAQFVASTHYRWHDRLYTRTTMPLYCRKAAAIISPTRTGAADIVRHLGVPPGKIVQIYEAAHPRFAVPVPEARRRATLARHGITEPFVLFVGGRDPRKNFPRLLEAFARFRARMPHLLVAPGFARWADDDADRARVRAMGLEGAVRFPGFVPDDDLPALYAAAEMLVCPSIYEGFGLPALEAMAQGCPVVASARGCAPEVVGDAALLADPYSVDDIEARMTRLASDRTLRDALVARGRQRAATFSWDRAACETLALFERVAARARTGRHSTTAAELGVPA